MTGGSMDVHVDPRDIKDWGEREAVAHAAWRELFREPRFGEKKNSSRIMLKKICDSMGVETAKKRFTEVITFEKQ
jgi:hypothetical protein